MKILFSLVGILFLAAGCSDPQPPTEESPKSASTEYPVVGTLVSKDYEVTLLSSPDETRYTLRDKAGTLMAEAITKQEMAKRFPKIHEEMVTLWAGNDIKAGVPLDSPVVLPPERVPFRFDESKVETDVDLESIPLK